MSAKRAPLGDIDVNRAYVGPAADNVKTTSMSSENPFATKSKIRRTPDKSNPEGSSPLPPLSIVVEPNVMAGSSRDYNDMENIRPISMNKKTTPRVQSSQAIHKPVIIKKTVRSTGTTSNNSLGSSSNSRQSFIQPASNEETTTRMSVAVEEKIVEVAAVVPQVASAVSATSSSSSSSSIVENNINSEEEVNGLAAATGGFDQLSIAEILDAFREDAAAAEEALSLATSFGRLRPEEFREYLRAFRSPLKVEAITGSSREVGADNINEGDDSNDQHLVDNSAMGGGFLMGIRGALTVPAYPSRFAHKQNGPGLGVGGNAAVSGTPKSTLWGLLGSADTPPIDIRVTDDVDEQTDDVEVCDINTSVCATASGKGMSLASTASAANQGIQGAAASTTTTASAAAATASRRVSVKTMASLMSSAAGEHATTATIAPSSTSDDALAAATADSGSPSGLHPVPTSAIETDHQSIAADALPPMLGDKNNMEGVTLGAFQPRKHLVRTPPKPTPALALAPERAHMDEGPSGPSSSSADVAVDAGVDGLADADTVAVTVAGGNAALPPALRGEEEGGATDSTTLLMAAAAATTPMAVQTLSIQPAVEDADGLDAAVTAREESRSSSAGGDAAVEAHDEDQLALWSAAELENVSRAIGRVSMGMSARAPCPATQSLVQQLQAELARLREEMQSQRLDVEAQLQRATAGMQLALAEAQNRTRDHEHARIDAEIMAAREAVDRLAAEKAVVAQQRLVRQERLARMDAEVALELAALEAKRAQRGVRDQQLLQADAQPSSVVMVGASLGSGGDVVEEEGGGGDSVMDDDVGAGDSYCSASANNHDNAGAFTSIAMTSQQRQQQALVPSADCVFVAPKARRATTTTQVVVDTEPSTRSPDYDYPTSSGRTSLLGAATESRRRLSSSSAFEPIDSNTSFSSSATRNHTRTSLATLPTGSSPLAASMQLQHEEVGEISAIEVEVTALSIDGVGGHLPEDNDIDNDGGPLLDCNEYGLDDYAAGGDDDVDFGGNDEGREEGREADAPASISNEKKDDKQEASNKQSKDRAPKAPRVHKPKEEASIRPRLPFEHGILKFVPLKVKQAWPRPIREKEFRAVARDHKDHNHVKREGSSSSSDHEDGNEEQDGSHGKTGKPRKETGKRRERQGSQNKDEEDAEEEDNDASDNYAEPTRKKKRGGATTVGASAAAASMKNKDKEVATKNNSNKGGRKGAVAKKAEDRDSKGQARRIKQGKKQTATAAAAAAVLAGDAPAVEVAKELFPEDSSSNHLGHGSDLDNNGNNDDRVQEKPSKPPKTAKSTAAALHAADHPAPPTASKTKAASAKALKGVATATASFSASTAASADGELAAPSAAAAPGLMSTQGGPRGQSSFALFCAVQKPLLLAEHPEAANSTVVKMLSALWKKLSPEEKKEWVMQATDGSAQASAAFDQRMDEKIASSSSSSAVEPSTASSSSSEPEESLSSSSSSSSSVTITATIKSTKKSSKSKGAAAAPIEAASAVAPLLHRIDEDNEEDENNDDDDDDDDLFNKRSNNKKSGKAAAAAAAKKRKQTALQKQDASDKEQGLAAKRGRTSKSSPVKSPVTKESQQPQLATMRQAAEIEEQEAKLPADGGSIVGASKGNKGGKNKKRKQSVVEVDVNDKENALSGNVHVGVGSSSSSSLPLSAAIDENPFLPVSRSSKLVTSSSRGSEGEVDDASLMPPPTKGGSKGKGKPATAANMTGTAAAANAAVLAARAMVALRKSNTSSQVPLTQSASGNASSSSSSSSSNITSSSSNNNNNTSILLNTSVSTVSSLISGSSKMGKMGGMILPKLKMKK